MASHHYDALWEKLHELEAQLAAYKLMRAAREADVAGCGEDAAETTAGYGACRGRQYDAYMRRRDARRVAAAASSSPEQQQQTAKAQQPRAARRRPMPLSPRALRCAPPRDDTQEAGTPRLAVALAKRAPPPALLSVPPTTPRKDTATTLARSRTVSSGGGGAVGSPARSNSYHQRRSSLGALAEFGEGATPRPFLKRGTGTGGAAVPARLRSTRVHDVTAIDVPSSTPRPAPPPPMLQEVLPRHARSVSEVPAFDAAALASPQAQGRARKRWGSPERPAAMFSSTTGAGDSYGRDLSKGLKKLLSFVRKGGKGSGGGGEQASLPAASPRGSGKPVTSKGGWSGCSLVDVPFDRAASLEAHRFPMTPRAVGITSG